MIGALLDYVQRAFGRFALTTSLAVRVRNQANAVIAYRIARSHNLETSGEKWLAGVVSVPHSVFVDVGANRGEWTSMWLAADPTPALGVLFEPSASAIQALRPILEANLSLRLVTKGVSDEPGRLPFLEEPDAGEQSSFVHPSVSELAPVLRDVTTLDIELSDVPRIHFLKIDVEGLDLHVLRGARTLLARRAVDVIQFEYGRAWAAAGSTLAGAFSLLNRFGYETYLLRPDGLWRFDCHKYGEFFGYANFVALSPAAALALGQHVRGTF